MFTPELMPSPDRIARLVDKQAATIARDFPDFADRKTTEELRRFVAASVIRALRAAEWAERT